MKRLHANHRSGTGRNRRARISPGGQRLFVPVNWQGALSPAGEPPDVPRLYASTAVPDAPLFCWFKWCLPTYNQIGPSCVGQGWANWLEMMLRRYREDDPFKPGEQISGEAIWKRGREMFWKGRMNGGLYLPQGLEAMKDLEYVPPESPLMGVEPDWASVGYALRETPLVQGHHVHAGWENPDPQSGCLDHAPAPTNADGYHCTLRMGRLVQSGRRFYVGQNSWGTTWGWRGLFVMTEDEDAEGRMSGPLYTANLPAGWTSWDGWKKGVIRC